MRIGTCPVVLNTTFFVRHETYFVKSICLGVSPVLLQELFVLWLRHSLTMYYIYSYTKKPQTYYTTKIYNYYPYLMLKSYFWHTKRC